MRLDGVTRGLLRVRDALGMAVVYVIIRVGLWAARVLQRVFGERG